MDQLTQILGSSLERAPWGWALFGMLFGALIKVWPVIQLQVMQAKEKLRHEKRDDLTDCQTRLDAMAVRLDGVEASAHQAELRLVSALSAYGVLEAEIQATNPSSLSLVQAKAILTASFRVPSAPPPDMTDTLSHAH